MKQKRPSIIRLLNIIFGKINFIMGRGLGLLNEAVILIGSTGINLTTHMTIFFTLNIPFKVPSYIGCNIIVSVTIFVSCLMLIRYINNPQDAAQKEHIS